MHHSHFVHSCNRLPVPEGAIFAPLALLGEAPLAVTGIMVALLLLAVVATFHLRKEMPWWAKGFITVRLSLCSCFSSL